MARGEADQGQALQLYTLALDALEQEIRQCTQPQRRSVLMAQASASMQALTGSACC